MTFEEIKKNKEINEFINKGNYNLGLLGYTDHSQIHCSIVADTAAMILKRFGYCEHDIELAKIAGYMHDIGNAINRSHHAEYGGLLANEILKKSDMDIKDRITSEKGKAAFDIHDRVNYAVTEHKLKVNIEKKTISLNLQIDTKICSMYEYFEIFLGRMMMCRGAADMLGATFKLMANGSKVL